ncbi:MAG: S9 family peptidase [Gemmatimonadetes bacterium]|nr:S9 family peptidase [Gemmatimonadota bacterium]MBK8648461.1 S9 family peptidase [Gemmatimonadota bacterium]MBK9411395.1 S9 family peptidase [Gemmatimonadota bacterium]
MRTPSAWTIPVVLFVLAAPMSPFAPALQAQARPLSASDMFTIETASDPQISPDGLWVAYVRNWSDAITDKRYSNIWLVKSDGTGHRPVTSGKTHDASPRWSPDGTRLAYTSDKGGSGQLYVRWNDTGESIALTNGAIPPAGPTWSPDGKLIAFTQFVPKAPLVVGTPLAPPPGATWAPPPKYTDALVFRFDGVGEVPVGFTHIFVVRADGGAPRQLSKGDFNHGGVFGGGGVVWTPDGTELIAAARRREKADEELLESDIFAFAVADGAMRQLTDRNGPDGEPAVSPDGKLIAYTGFDERYQGYQNALLYVMNRDGSGKRALSTKLDNSVGSPTWSADGKGIYVQYDDKGDTKVGLFALDGSWRVVASHLGSGMMAYSGGSYSVARNGSVAYTLSTPSIPSNVAVVGSGASATPVSVTSLNVELLATRTLGAVEEIWYESSKDKRKIQGWIIKPPGFDAKKKYPLILEIHGGPFANYGARFDDEKQIMAANGFVVLYTNPRGSTSYGEEFGNLIHHAYPGDDFFDLNSGVDAVIAKGYIDEKNLFVTGGSGGGVLTAWMIGHTDRFRAALAFYPVINWESFSLTADMAPLSVKNWFPGMPWDHKDNYDKRSLLSVVKNVKTPTLIMTGEEDFRTPMSESEQYYKALKMSGVEAVLVRVPGEPHGIRRFPSHAASKLTTLAGWFEKHRAPVQ